MWWDAFPLLLQENGEKQSSGNCVYRTRRYWRDVIRRKHSTVWTLGEKLIICINISTDVWLHFEFVAQTVFEARALNFRAVRNHMVSTKNILERHFFYTCTIFQLFFCRWLLPFPIRNDQKAHFVFEFSAAYFEALEQNINLHSACLLILDVGIVDIRQTVHCIM